MNLKTALAPNIFYRFGNVTVLFLITTVLASALGVEQYGLLSLLLLNCAVFVLFSSLGSDAGLVYMAAKQNAPLNEVVSVQALLLLAQLLLLFLVEGCWFLVFGRHLLYPASSMQGFWLSVLLVFGMSVQDKCAALLNGRGWFVVSNRALFFCNVLALLAMVFVMKTTAAAPEVYIGIVTASTLLPAILLTVFAVRKLKLVFFTGFRRRHLRLFFAYSLFAFATNCIQFLAYRVDLWMVAYFGTDNEVGWYALAVRLVQLMWLLPTLVAAMVLPKLSAEGKAFDAGDLHTLLRVMNFLNMIATVVLIACAPWLLPAFFGEDFRSSVIAFQLLLPGVSLFANATVLAAYFAGLNKLRINFRGSLLCLLTVGLLDVLLIPTHGYVGAAIASTVAYTATTLYFMWVYCRQTGYDWRTLVLPQKSDWTFLRTTGKNFFSANT